MTLPKSVFQFGLLACSVVLAGCGVGALPPSDMDTSKKPFHQKVDQVKESVFESGKHGVRKAVKTLTQSPTQAIVRAVKEVPGPKVRGRNSSVLANPNPLHPKGRWVGMFLPENGGEHPMELNLDIAKKAFLMPKPKPRKSFWSSWSLFRSAHACGPYAPPVVHLLSGSFALKSSDSSKRDVTISGSVRTYDAFRYSSTVRLKIGSSWQANALVLRNANTKKLELHGSVFILEGKKYKRIARFLLKKAKP